MSVNKYLPHVYVLPEDDANRQLANGFQLAEFLDERRMQVLEEAGGWREVLTRFREDHAPEMDRYASRFMVLLIDFDGRQDRLETVRAAIPDHLQERVFVLGTLSEPEDLRQDLGPYETIGLELAKECQEGVDVIWAHALLRHNTGELQRLRAQVRAILFSDD